MSSCRFKPAQNVDVQVMLGVDRLLAPPCRSRGRAEARFFFLSTLTPCFGREVGGAHVFGVDVTSLLRTGLAWESNVAATVSQREQEISRARPACWDGARFFSP